MNGRGWRIAATALALLAAPGAADAREYFTLVVSGASGGPEYAARHDRWRSGLVAALRAQPGFREDHLLVLAETPGPGVGCATREEEGREQTDERHQDPGPGVGCATREEVRRVFRELAARMDEQSVLFVLLLGHGTFDGREARFNLVGPDLTAAEWAALVDPLPGQLVFVNTTAASAPFLAPLAKAGRVVITATESPAQRYATVFPEFLVRAFADAASDFDRNARVSVWEAFSYASAGVRRWYRERGRLATERALLDDTGDGRGIDAGDGAGDPHAGLAAAAYVGAGVDHVTTGQGAEMDRLAARRAALDVEVAELRAVREAMPAERYAAELERLLLELARVSRELRRLTGGAGRNGR